MPPLPGKLHHGTSTPPPCPVQGLKAFLCTIGRVVRCLGKLSEICSIYRGIIQGSGLGPTLYLRMECDLQPKLVVNLLLKYADDTNLLVPENTDVELADEFIRHVIQWADDNKMIINEPKTKEIVFRRPSPKRFHIYPSVNSVELVTHTKLLGVCSQRIFLMKSLRNHTFTLYFRLLLLSLIHI